MHHTQLKTISVKESVFSANNQIAEHNRRLFYDKGITAVNVISSPGSGKTTLLQATIERLGDELAIGVIEGDIQGSYDAERLSHLGVPVVQINTESACHLDAAMVGHGLKNIHLEGLDLLIIENVGNLVCPAEFDVGERAKVALLSVPEGDDKPLKYPLLFRQAAAVVVTKIDMLPGSDFDLARVERVVHEMNHHADLIQVSAKTGQGMDLWCAWLQGLIAGH